MRAIGSSWPFQCLSIILIISHSVIVIVGQQIYERDYRPTFGALNIVEVILITFIIFEFLLGLLLLQHHFITAWNIFDLLLIVFLIAFYIADVVVHNFYASAVFKLRALFRMYRLTLLVQNIFSPKFSLKNKVQGVWKSPVEEVSDILYALLWRAKKGTPVKLDKNQLEFCLKVIKSGRIYEVDIKAIEREATDVESLNWIR